MCAKFKGDEGYTDLIGEDGVSKADARIEAIGAIDEAWAACGFARSLVKRAISKTAIFQIQKDLYILMAQLAGFVDLSESKSMISDDRVKWLEDQITELEREVIMPESFITSGDSPAGGALAMARTIVRRAERRVVALTLENENIDKVLIKYLNRLSSLCFMMELAEY